MFEHHAAQSSPENRDLRQLLWHRHRLVQMRTRIMNQLQALAKIIPPGESLTFA
jgi:hypothetical protein